MEVLVEEQMGDIIAEFFGVEDAAFECKQQESEEGTWCDPIPLDTKIETVQAFYQQLHDENTMPIQPCAVCYTQTSPSLRRVAAFAQLDEGHIVVETQFPQSRAAVHERLNVVQTTFIPAHANSLAAVLDFTTSQLPKARPSPPDCPVQ